MFFRSPCHASINGMMIPKWPSYFQGVGQTTSQPWIWSCFIPHIVFPKRSQLTSPLDPLDEEMGFASSPTEAALQYPSQKQLRSVTSGGLQLPGLAWCLCQALILWIRLGFSAVMHDYARHCKREFWRLHSLAFFGGLIKWFPRWDFWWRVLMGLMGGTSNPPGDPTVTHCEVQLIPSPPVSQVSSDPAEDAYRLLLSTLGIAESSRHELDKTPARAAKAFREMTAGLRVEDPLWLGSWLRRYPLVIKHGNGEDPIFLDYFPWLSHILSLKTTILKHFPASHVWLYRRVRLNKYWLQLPHLELAGLCFFFGGGCVENLICCVFPLGMINTSDQCICWWKR